MLVRWTFAHVAERLPLRKVGGTGRTIAFMHPKPAYPGHVLIVSKQGIRSIGEFTDRDGLRILDLLQVAQAAARTMGIDECGYRIVLNAGGYQDIKQVHAHLIPAEGSPPSQ